MAFIRGLATADEVAVLKKRGWKVVELLTPSDTDVPAKMIEIYVDNDLFAILSGENCDIAPDYVTDCEFRSEHRGSKPLRAEDVAGRAKRLRNVLRKLEEDSGEENCHLDADELVHDVANSIAADANNGGLDEQALFLIRHDGFENALRSLEALLPKKGKIS